ncbi:MAG: CcdB family protein [Thermomonas sp.]|uniref:CcdB family protein n=1 Tax=Thermomonas sp. TaxID=1971895 RepID=UPI0039E26366
MAQFDVHRYPGRGHDGIAYVVVVQSAYFDDYHRRVVIPLMKKSGFGGQYPARFAPTFVVEGEPVVLVPLDVFSLPKDSLGKPVASLAEHGQRIIDAMDELMTRAFG